MGRLVSRRPAWQLAVGGWCLAVLLACLGDNALGGRAQGERQADRAYASGGSRLCLPLTLRGRGVATQVPAPTSPPGSRTPSATPSPQVTSEPASPTAAQSATPRPTPTYICPPLVDRLRLRSIDVHPLEVKTGSVRSRTTSPIFVAPDSGVEGAHVAWADTDGSVHVTALDYYDLPTGREAMVDGDEVRGLVVHDDGVALLVVRGDSLFLVRLDEAGAVEFEERLVGGTPQTTVGSKWVDNWGHEARLVWDGERYSAYSGHTQYFGARGKHQGDLLWHFDAQGRRIDEREGWDWGCSHSLDLRLAHNGVRLGAVCLSDSFPTKGIHFHHREKQIRSEPSGDGAGYSAANLGGWVPVAGGFHLTFSSPEGRRSSDVGLVHVSNDANVAAVHWLTDTPDVEESAPHLARYGRAFVAAWTAGDEHRVAVVGADLEIADGPVAIAPTIAPRDDFVTLPNGDVLWAYSAGDRGTLHIARLEACADERVLARRDAP